MTGMKYARERKQFGEAIGKFPAISNMIADMDVRHGGAGRIAQFFSGILYQNPRQSYDRREIRGHRQRAVRTGHASAIRAPTPARDHGHDYHEAQTAADRLDHYAHQVRRLHDAEYKQGWRHESAADG